MTARYLVDPSLWNSVISVAVANVGGLPVGSVAPLGGFGTGFGGVGFYNSVAEYGTGGGGGSSVKVGDNFLVIAGGRGGCFSRSNCGVNAGGNGGTPNGFSGTNGCGTVGGGATQTAVGVNTANPTYNGVSMTGGINVGGGGGLKGGAGVLVLEVEEDPACLPLARLSPLVSP